MEEFIHGAAQSFSPAHARPPLRSRSIRCFQVFLGVSIGANGHEVIRHCIALTVCGILPSAVASRTLTSAHTGNSCSIIVDDFKSLKFSPDSWSVSVLMNLYLLHLHMKENRRGVVGGEGVEAPQYSVFTFSMRLKVKSE